METSHAANRTYLLCPVCRKTWPALSQHLTRTCMKHNLQDIPNAVAKAKADAHEILVSGRVFTFEQIQNIMKTARPLHSMIEELQKRHMVVRNIPFDFYHSAVEQQPGGHPVQQPSAPAAAEQSDESEGVGSSSSGETFQDEPNVGWQTKKRQLMLDMGLYKKHSRDHKLLRQYATYLHKDRQIENYTQDVDNVARYLYYMDPREPSLQFVLNKEKTQQYFRDLTQAGLMKQTQINYLKNLKCFLKFHTYHTDLKKRDPELHGHCGDFIEFLGLLQETCSKQVSKEVVRKRHGVLSTDCQLSTKDCVAVLKTAKKDFLTVIGKVFPNETELTTPEITLVVYYLEALITLKHLQRVGVVKNMTVEEWIKRTKTDDGHAVVGVKEHKTASHQVAMFALDQEEEMWFDTYYTRIRPQIFRSKKCKVDKDDGRFFLSFKGTPIYNASNDVQRLHEKYELNPVTNQEARRVYETAMKTWADSDKILVADYLTHSNTTAERHNRMKLPENVVRARQILDVAAGDSSNESDSTSNGTQPERIVIQSAYKRMVAEHPVTLDGKAPGKEVRRAFSAEFERKLYHRWLRAQKKLREQHMLEHFTRRLPSEARLASWIKARGWKGNAPNVSEVIVKWKPTGNVEDAISSPSVQKYVKSQKWKGLLITDIEGKNKGVVTTRDFKKGEVVCDYHGRVVSGEEGKRIHAETSPEETGYMFFYKKNGMDLCIDAHQTHCDCHPDIHTIGRHINHSHKKSNLRPRLYTVTEDESQTDVILFLASRDIKVNEELLFDYGVNKRSFRGEGLELD